MPTIIDIALPHDRASSREHQVKAAARKLNIPPKAIRDLRLIKESIDARRAPVKLQLRLEVAINEELPPIHHPAAHYHTLPPTAKNVIIVGTGPAGLFAGLRCLELNIKPILIERGKDASARRFDLAPILRKGTVIQDSNYCFGEGGAGTFSDGKLYTRATKRGPVMDIYQTLVAHGAPPRILTDAHPHIGSNLLPNVVKNMRESIRQAGGEVHFQTKVTGLLRSADGNRLHGVTTADGRAFTGAAVILATGHSARDIYQLLHKEGILLEQKPFAMGVRIEHPQPMIDACQYHYPRGQERPRTLPAASYRLATKIDGRGVHSFCMCPGGFIVPAATENDEVVVNGMSLARRDSPFANSGMVVTIEPEDTLPFQKEHGVLAGMAMQKALEVATSLAGGGMQKAPAQLVPDFLKGRMSGKLNQTSYHPGLTPYRLDELLPESIVTRMKTGLRCFAKSFADYTGPEGMLIGCETRTSSPVRIPRNPTTLMHPELEGLYPCGEGAGFAGGIVSAALDGMRCAEAINALSGSGTP